MSKDTEKAENYTIASIKGMNEDAIKAFKIAHANAHTQQIIMNRHLDGIFQTLDEIAHTLARIEGKITKSL